MDSTVIAAIIGALATILAALTPVVFVPVLKSKSFRSRYKIPNILGTWQNEWFIAEKLYVKDIIKIDKWSRNNQFQGTGYEEKGEYKVSGEIDTSRVLVATYKNVEYPTKGYIGTFILELSVDGKSMEGYWYGRTAGGSLEGGKVFSKQI